MIDPVEKIIQEALDNADYTYRRDDPLDFECKGFAIECKRMFSERAIRQLKGRENVILVQGIEAAEWLALILRVASRQPDGGTDWHLIDDPDNPAPRDGRHILMSMGVGFPVWQAAWTARRPPGEPKERWNKFGPRWERVGFCDTAFQPTHWQKLPEPPA